MGGCRCSYKNCTARSDGKTHLFHYPVLDKLRCLLWLKNANKLEFLDLTVAQLRNRVVCQHHFVQNQFMNFKKDKLTFNAVPTEDGPFCAPNKGTNDYKLDSFCIEDIENDISLVDSNYRPNFSKRYVDFLTNGDINDLSQLNQNLKLNTKYDKEKLKSIEINETTENRITHKENIENVLLKSSEISEDPLIIVDPYVLTIEQPKNDSNLKRNKNDKNYYRDDNTQLTTNNNIHSPNKILQIDVPELNKFIEREEPSNKGATKGNRIKIISEKKVNIPVTTFVGGPISPSKPIKVNDRKNTKEINNKVTEQDLLSTNNDNKERYFTSLQNKEDSNIDTCIQIKENNSLVSNEETAPELHNGKPNEANLINKQPDKRNLRNCTLRPNLARERKAAIEEKRKFNKKVASETGLSKLKDKTPNNNQINVSVSKDVDRDIGLIRLEAKLEQMQNLLLNKIDQNSRKINDLKDVIKPVIQKPSYVNKHTSTNVDNYRKYLFQEISTFLSPTTNSLLYEELFLRKFSEEVPEPKKKKKR